MVFVAGEIGGEAAEKADGCLIRGTFGYRFVVDGRVFKTVADKSNNNMPTLLLPGDADLSRVTMEGTPGWTVTYGDTSDSSGKVALDFASAENNTLTLTVTPPEEVAVVSISVTVPLSVSSSSASTVMVADCPTCRHRMSDSSTLMVTVIWVPGQMEKKTFSSSEEVSVVPVPDAAAEL